MPSASMAEAMVLAVYMPPHAPGPGHEVPHYVKALLLRDQVRRKRA